MGGVQSGTPRITTHDSAVTRSRLFIYRFVCLQAPEAPPATLQTSEDADEEGGSEEVERARKEAEITCTVAEGREGEGRGGAGRRRGVGGWGGWGGWETESRSRSVREATPTTY